MAALPAIGPLPPAELGPVLLLARRRDNDILYVPQPAEIETAIYQRPEVAGRLPELRQAGANLATLAFNVIRQDDLRDKVRQAPYPRLQRQLDVLGEAEMVTRGDVRGFIHPHTGAEVQLSDIE
jgi:hypothetical protein